MSNELRILVVLPTYNERENIVALVADILKRDDRIDVLVVDDMSPDGTATVVRNVYEATPRVHLLERTARRGRGLAGVAGFRHGVENGYAAVIEMDADWSHDPKYIPSVISHLESSDVVICSRLIPGGGEEGRGSSRRTITTLANLYLRLILGLTVRDCTTGFRGFRASALAAIDWDSVKAGGPSIVQEVLFILARLGFSVTEIPFVFTERRAGESKLNIRILISGLFDAILIRLRHAGVRRRKGMPNNG